MLKEEKAIAQYMDKISASAVFTKWYNTKESGRLLRVVPLRTHPQMNPSQWANLLIAIEKYTCVCIMLKNEIYILKKKCKGLLYLQKCDMTPLAKVVPSPKNKNK